MAPVEGAADRLRRLRGDVEGWFARLAPRERLLVGAAGAAFVLFIFSLVFASVGRAASRHAAAIERKTEVIAQVGKLAQAYRQTQAERAGLEARLRGPPLQLMSFVAQAGQRLGVEVNDLHPGAADATASPADPVSEETVEVNLAKLDLQKLAALLAELERGPGVVKVRRLTLRARNDDPSAVDATVVVATFRLKEGRRTAPAGGAP